MVFQFIAFNKLGEPELSADRLLKIVFGTVIYVSYISIKKIIIWTSLVVQWLGLCTSAAGGSGSIPGRGIKIPHAARHGPKGKKKR